MIKRKTGKQRKKQRDKKTERKGKEKECIFCQSYVRHVSSCISRERNSPKKTFFYDDVGE